MAEVYTFGECMVVMYPPDPVTIDDAPLLKWDIGGAEANCAIALTRLGVSVQYQTRIGNDPFGRKMVEILAGEGIEARVLNMATVSIPVKFPLMRHGRRACSSVNGCQTAYAACFIIELGLRLATWAPKISRLSVCRGSR